MPDIRQRKQQRKTEHGVKPKHKHEKTKTVESNGVYYEEEKSRISSVIWQYFNILLGVSASFYIGYRYALYMKELHENDMWFSNIGVSLYKEIIYELQFNSPLSCCSCVSEQQCLQSSFEKLFL